MKTKLSKLLENGFYKQVYDQIDKEIISYTLDNVTEILPKMKDEVLYNFMIYALSREESIDKYIVICLIIENLIFIDDYLTLVHWYSMKAIQRFPESIKMQSRILDDFYDCPDTPFTNEEMIQFAKDILKQEPSHSLANKIINNQYNI